MDRSFQSMMYTCYFNVPGYPRWLMAQNHAKSYRGIEALAEAFAVSGAETAGPQVAAEGVHHFLSGGLRTMMDTFPEAKAIITHRPLKNVIASFASAWGPFLRNYAPGVDVREMGRASWSGTRPLWT